jgi:hypothetical protein
MNKRTKFFTYLKVLFFLTLGLLIAGAIVIKTQPGLAATIADNYLRPVIGTDRTFVLEQFFFNVSDKTAQLEYKFKSPTAPQFLNQINNNNLSSSSLDLTPISVPSSQSLQDEGVWHNLSVNVSLGKEVLAYTFVRPDPTRAFATVSLVQMDMSQLRIGAVAGSKEPGTTLGNPGPGTIPQNIIDSGNLVAAFNGGFLYVDGNYGMIVGNKTYVPLKNDVGTIVGYTDGTVKILNYTGQDLGKNVAFARQNGPLLIDNSAVVLDATDMKVAKGKVLHGGIYTWRSGIGVTKSGNLIYAAGNNLSPTTLAKSLQMAGAVSAIQLDINPSQVRFDLFDRNASGTYDVTPLNKELAYLSNKEQYLKGHTRDFFYVYKQ